MGSRSSTRCIGDVVSKQNVLDDQGAMRKIIKTLLGVHNGIFPRKIRNENSAS
jgi:hypothetical protein